MRSTSEIAVEVIDRNWGMLPDDVLEVRRRVTAALDAERREGDDLKAIILDAYNGISVLRSICKHYGLKGYREASEQLIERMTEAMPELPGLSSLRMNETD